MHNNDPITPLDPRADLATVIAKINELIEHINFMWSPEEPPTP